METFIDILKVLGAIFVLGQPLFLFYIVRKTKKKHAAFSSMSENELIDLGKRNPFIHLSRVIEELKARDTNYGMLIPYAVRLATDNNSAARLSGWNILKAYFPNEFPEIDFNKDKLTRTELQLLREQSANQKLEPTR